MEEQKAIPENPMQWVQKFINEALDQFEKELHRYETVDGFPSPWNLYSERPLVGLINNAIIRNHIGDNQVITLQEYIVKKEGSVGRCDLYFANNNYNVLFEAKYIFGSYGVKAWKPDNIKIFNQNIHNQLSWYYEKNYDGKMVFGVSLVFHVINRKDLKEYLSDDSHEDCYLKEKHFNETKDGFFEKQGENYFYKLIKSSEGVSKDLTALEVWGQIKQLN